MKFNLNKKKANLVLEHWVEILVCLILIVLLSVIFYNSGIEFFKSSIGIK